MQTYPACNFTLYACPRGGSNIQRYETLKILSPDCEVTWTLHPDCARGKGTFLVNIILWFDEGVLPEHQCSGVPLPASSWWLAVCGQSIPVQLLAASQRPPNTGPSCSSGTCAAARWRPHTLAWRERGRRTGGWWRAGGCPGPCSCRQAEARRRW